MHLRKILRVPRRTADAPPVLAFDRRTGAAAGRYEVRPDGASHVVGDLTVTRGGPGNHQPPSSWPLTDSTAMGPNSSESRKG